MTRTMACRYPVQWLVSFVAAAQVRMDSLDSILFGGISLTNAEEVH